MIYCRRANGNQDIKAASKIELEEFENHYVLKPSPSHTMFTEPFHINFMQKPSGYRSYTI